MTWKCWDHHQKANAAAVKHRGLLPLPVFSTFSLETGIPALE